MPKPEAIIAIDPARSCGYAVGFVSHGVLWSGAWQLGQVAKHRCGILQYHLMMQQMYLRQNYCSTVTHLAVEGVATRQMHAGTLSHAKLLGACEAFAGQQITVIEYSPTAIKKHATGNGRSKKPDMIEAARKLTRHKPDTHDEADALCLFHLACTDLKNGRRP